MDFTLYKINYYYYYYYNVRFILIMIKCHVMHLSTCQRVDRPINNESSG